MRTLVETTFDLKWANIIPIAPDHLCSDNRGMINKVIKLKLQCFFHTYVHVKESQKCMRHNMIPKYILTPKFRIPTSNSIQICSELDIASTETRGQGHSDMETVGDLPGPKMYLHTKYGMLP